MKVYTAAAAAAVVIVIIVVDPRQSMYCVRAQQNERKLVLLLYRSVSKYKGRYSKI